MTTKSNEMLSRGPILLVDDLENVLDYTKAILNHAGFTNIITYDCPLEALQAVKDGLIPSTVVTDFRMPGMNGADLLKAISSIYPDTNAVITTGDPETAKHSTRFPVIEKGKPDFFKTLIGLLTKSKKKVSKQGIGNNLRKRSKPVAVAKRQSKKLCVKKPERNENV